MSATGCGTSTATRRRCTCRGRRTAGRSCTSKCRSGIMDPIRALIVEDERLARARLVRLLRRRDDIEVIGVAVDGDEAVQLIDGAHPDLLFLDIQLPSRTGFDILGAFDDAELPFVIFTTAYHEHALRAFQVHALDYLLKPFDEERLNDAVDRAVRIIRGTRAVDRSGVRELTRSAPLSRLVVREPGRILFLDAADVDWIEAAENYVYLHARGKKHLVRGTIKSFAERLDPRQFIRVHRSTIVNLERVREVESKRVVLRDGTTVPISRNFAAELRRRLRPS